MLWLLLVLRRRFWFAFEPIVVDFFFFFFFFWGGGGISWICNIGLCVFSSLENDSLRNRELTVCLLYFSFMCVFHSLYVMGWSVICDISWSYSLVLRCSIDWLQSLKQFFIAVSYHILVANLTLEPSELD